MLAPRIRDGFTNCRPARAEQHQERAASDKAETRLRKPRPTCFGRHESRRIFSKHVPLRKRSRESAGFRREPARFGAAPTRCGSSGRHLGPAGVTSPLSTPLRSRPARPAIGGRTVTESPSMTVVSWSVARCRRDISVARHVCTEHGQRLTKPTRNNRAHIGSTCARAFSDGPVAGL